MTVVLLIAKAFVLVGIAVAAFAGLAMAMGVDPMMKGDVARCAASLPQMCMFRIF